MTQKPSSTPTRFHSDADRIPPLKDCPASAHLSFPLWVRGHKVGSGKLYVHVARSSLLQQTQPKRYIRYQRGHILGGFFFFCLLLLPRGTCRIRTFTRGLIGAKDTVDTFCRSLTHSRTSWCMEMLLGGFLCRLLRSASGYPSQWIHSERQRRTNNGSVLELRTRLIDAKARSNAEASQGVFHDGVWNSPPGASAGPQRNVLKQHMCPKVKWWRRTDAVK